MIKRYLPVLLVFLAALAFIIFVGKTSEGECSEAKKVELKVTACHPGHMIGFAKFNDDLTDYKLIKEERIIIPGNDHRERTYSVMLVPGKYGVTLFEDVFVKHPVSGEKVRIGFVRDYVDIEVKEEKDNKINFCFR